MADRISYLPDTILCRILSLLPTKQAVATSVLSKNWKLLWRFVPILDFDDGNFAQRLEEFRCTYAQESRYTYAVKLETYFRETYYRFAEFVSAVLLLRDWNQPIQKFSLRCSSLIFPDGFHVRTWIHTVLQSRVEHLHLSLPPVSLGMVTPYATIVNCSTLVVLKLENLFLELPSSPHFPSLKILHMEDVGVYDHLHLSDFLSGCAILEDLKMKKLWYRRGTEIIPIINSSTLVVLELERLLLELPSSPHFPSLKILHMKNSKIIGEDLSKFLSACPVLEDLKTN